MPLTQRSPALAALPLARSLASPQGQFTATTQRELTGIDFGALKDQSFSGGSTSQLAALVTELTDGEAIVAHLRFHAPRSAGLILEVIGCGETAEGAKGRCRRIGPLLDAAIASGLPGAEIAKRKTRISPLLSAHDHTISPAGLTLPLSRHAAGRLAPCVRAGSEHWRPESIVFSPSALGAHLGGLESVIAAMNMPLSIEVRIEHVGFDAAVLKQITDVRHRILDRQHADAQRFVRDPRYGEADARLEALLLAGSAVRLNVSIKALRELEACEISALSAVLFGKPQSAQQPGHLSDYRNLYPHDEAVRSFFGLIAAALLPILERRQVSQLDTLEGNVIGKLKSGHKLRMATAVPRSHTYVVGRPGSGKSTLLMNLILQDIAGDEAVVLIDPHGDLWADIRDRIPPHRKNDLLLVHMGEPALQPALNLLQLGPGDPAEERALVVDTMYQLIRRMMFSGLTIDATGPLFNKYFRAALLLLLEAEGANASLAKFETVFSDPFYRDDLRTRAGVSAETLQQWRQILDTGGEHTLDNMVPWVTSKLTQLTQSTILRPILGGTTTSLDFGSVIAKRQICLINLANGRIGTEAAGLLGGILTHRLEQAAKRQAGLSADARGQTSVYFDEFHTFASEFLRPLMAETRKYGLRLTLANQTLSQMINNDIAGGIIREVLGNCANTIVFAVDAQDAVHLAPRFGGRIDPGVLVAQPNFQAVCQFQTRKGCLGPFTVRTLPAAKT